MPSTVGTTPQTAFAGTGFSPDPSVAGRLNSNAWAVTGWTDGALAFGGTRTTTGTDYVRGAVSTAQSTGGMYAFTGSPGSVSNPTLMFQPGGSDFAPGTITLRIQNKGTTAITSFSISYDLFVRNDQGRASSFNFSYSSDDLSYIAVSSVNYTTPEALDALGWVRVGSSPSRSLEISGLNIAPNSFFYLRWSSADVSGSGSRDEIGLDNINISATYQAPIPSLAINDVSQDEGNSGSTIFTFTVSLSSPAPAGGVTFDIATADNTATTANNDYVAKSLTGQTVPAGSSTYAFTVTVNGDVHIEPNETFFVNVTNVTGATVVDGQGQGTIVNDDVAPGAALRFDGSDDHVVIGEVLPAASSYTKEAWVFATSGSLKNILGSNGNPFWLNGGKLQAGNNGSYSVVQDPATFPLNTWTHVVVTYDAATSTMKLYKNGELVATNTAAPAYSGGSMAIGGHFPGGSATFAGAIDEVRIWNRALCQAEIQHGRNCEIATTAPGLLANYHFNQGAAEGNNTAVTSLTDASGNNYNGTISGFALSGSASNFVAQGGVVSGSDCGANNDGEINVQGNSVTIPDGGNTPSATDHSDFGVVSSSTNLVRTFTIQNLGTGSLSVSGINVSGTNASLFTVGALTPASPIAPNGSATFTVTFAPTSAGLKTAIITIASSDCDESSYDFTVQGTGSVTYYPRVSATDLGVTSNWTDAPSGIGGNAPANFSTPNQEFNLNNNVASPVVNGAWALGGGSNLVLNNTEPLVFNATASFSLGAGSSANFNGKPVVLKSTAAGTAFIGQITGTLTGASNVTVERYISSLNNRAYRLLTPSVNTTTSIRQNWQEGGSNTSGFGTHITGSTTGANGFDATQTGQGSLFTLDPVSFTWQTAANTNATTLSAKEGYLLFIRGDRTLDLNTLSQPLPSNNTTLRATGTLLTGPQSFTGLYGAGEFNLVTNPYAAPINWPQVRAASENLSAYYTLWDPNVGEQGGYVTVHTTGVKSNPASNATVNIQSGQAFFIQATAGSPSATVNILETHKATQNNVDVFRAGSHSEMLTSSLYYTNGNGTRINADAVTSIFDNSYSASVDGDDATQMPNWDEDIAISRSGSLLSIEGRPLIDERDTIYFTLARLQPRTYEWQFETSGFNHPNLQAVLIDKFLNTRTPINLTGTTLIPFTVTGAPASAAADRFMVVFAPVVALPVSLTSVKAYQKGSDIQVEWTTQSEVNMEKYEVEKSTNGQQFTKIGSAVARGGNATNHYGLLDQQANSGANYYRIKALGKNASVQYSKVVRVNMGKVVSEVTAYPNPLTENAVSLSVNLSKGVYTITLTNAVGQRVYRKQLVHQGGAATQTIHFERGLANGIYHLSVTNGEQHFVQTLTKQ